MMLNHTFALKESVSPKRVAIGTLVRKDEHGNGRPDGFSILYLLIEVNEPEKSLCMINIESRPDFCAVNEGDRILLVKEKNRIQVKGL
jgi:hypothetical protein